MRVRTLYVHKKRTLPFSVGAACFTFLKVSSKVEKSSDLIIFSSSN